MIVVLDPPDIFRILSREVPSYPLAMKTSIADSKMAFWRCFLFVGNAGMSLLKIDL